MAAGGVVASAAFAAAFLATAGPALAAAGGFPVLAVAALWLHGSQRRPPPSSLVGSLLERLEERDRYTASHCSRVAAFADLIAEELGFRQRRRLRHLRIAALLHDLGKLDVPLAILHKPGRLDDREWDAMRAHVQAGCQRAAPLRGAVCRIIEQHHERPDGKGYPRGLRGKQISLEARIVAVADAFDAMTSDRPYREALDAQVALAELRRAAGAGTGAQFDPEVVEALARRFDEAAALCTEVAAHEASPLA